MKILVTGGAGFIGSHLVDRLMSEGHQVIVVDNLSGGQLDFIKPHLKSQRFKFIKLDLRQSDKLAKLLTSDIDLVYHLAANANIQLGVSDPTLDYENSIVATFSLLQAMRHHRLKKIVYTSGSGVYGDQGIKFLSESFGPLEPVSMYGATKLGGEGLISAFAHLFDMRVWILRPANIIGPRVTHGVVFDFMTRLNKNPQELKILGDGEQSKAYLHVSDVVDALTLVNQKAEDRVNFFNISSNSFITVNKIAQLVTKEMGLKNVKITHTPGKVGWTGDVAIVRLSNAKISQLGWRSHYSSREAVIATIKALIKDPRIATQ